MASIGFESVWKHHRIFMATVGNYAVMFVSIAPKHRTLLGVTHTQHTCVQMQIKRNRQNMLHFVLISIFFFFLFSVDLYSMNAASHPQACEFAFAHPHNRWLTCAAYQNWIVLNSRRFRLRYVVFVHCTMVHPKRIGCLNMLHLFDMLQDMRARLMHQVDVRGSSNVVPKLSYYFRLVVKVARVLCASKTRYTFLLQYDFRIDTYGKKELKIPATAKQYWSNQNLEKQNWK